MMSPRRRFAGRMAIHISHGACFALRIGEGILEDAQ